MQKTLQNFLEQWIQIIKEWSDALLRKKKDRGWYPQPLILSKRAGKGCILLQLQRNTPGAVSTWRFNCELLQERSLLITLDNLADLERHLQRANRQKDPANTARENIDFAGRTVTHRIAVSLIQPLKRAEFIGVWDTNLIDHWATVHAEDYKAERLVVYIALRVLSTYETMPEFFERQIRSQEWWEQRIARLCEGEFSKNHDIHRIFRSEVARVVY
jgi:hypothetical protein